MKVNNHTVFSNSLKKTMKFDVYLPPSFGENTHRLPFLILNDGQDMEAVQLVDAFSELYDKDRKIRSVIAIAIYPNDRMQEYGTAAMADYANRGSEAGSYASVHC